MKKAHILAAILFVLTTVRGFALVTGDQVLYLIGSSPLHQETLGSFDTGDNNALVFRAEKDRIHIPYAGVSEVRYHDELKRHLRVLPAIAVGIVRHRKYRHFVSIQWKDAADITQQATFEVAKTAPNGLLALIRAKSPKATCTATLEGQVKPCSRLP